MGNINKNNFDKAPLAFFRSSWICSLDSTAKERASDMESTLSLLARSTGMSAVPKKYYGKQFITKIKYHKGRRNKRGEGVLPSKLSMDLQRDPSFLYAWE
jgi:hypothetical protein